MLEGVNDHRALAEALARKVGYFHDTLVKRDSRTSGRVELTCDRKLAEMLDFFARVSGLYTFLTRQRGDLDENFPSENSEGVFAYLVTKFPVENAKKLKQQIEDLEKVIKDNEIPNAVKTELEKFYGLSQEDLLKRVSAMKGHRNEDANHQKYENFCDLVDKTPLNKACKDLDEYYWDRFLSSNRHEESGNVNELLDSSIGKIKKVWRALSFSDKHGFLAHRAKDLYKGLRKLQIQSSAAHRDALSKSRSLKEIAAIAAPSQAILEPKKRARNFLESVSEYLVEGPEETAQYSCFILLKALLNSSHETETSKKLDGTKISQKLIGVARDHSWAINDQVVQEVAKIAEDFHTPDNQTIKDEIKLDAARFFKLKELEIKAQEELRKYSPDKFEEEQIREFTLIHDCFAAIIDAQVFCEEESYSKDAINDLDGFLTHADTFFESNDVDGKKAELDEMLKALSQVTALTEDKKKAIAQLNKLREDCDSSRQDLAQSDHDYILNKAIKFVTNPPEGMTKKEHSEFLKKVSGFKNEDCSRSDQEKLKYLGHIVYAERKKPLMAGSLMQARGHFSIPSQPVADVAGPKQQLVPAAH